MTNRLLHITNGDSAAATIRACGVEGEVLPWRDVLHDGPVPGGLAAEALAERRAAYLAAAGAGDDLALKNDFDGRDACLTAAEACAEMVLWFEHDLYDQLQILQVLDRLRDGVPAGVVLSMICIDRFPGIEPFYGLGQLEPAQMASLFPQRRAVTPVQSALGRAGWDAFTAGDPGALIEYLGRDLAPLPFLRPALRRFLQDYPWIQNGLGRTEQQILTLVADGESRPAALFAAAQGLEEAPFMGDWSFWGRIAGLTEGPEPLLACLPDGRFRSPPRFPADSRFRDQRLTMTDAGRAVLAGRADALALKPLDRWYGGVHLRSDQPHWRWDPARATLRAVPA